MALTKEEKVRRYESLQCAIQIMLDSSRRQQKDAERESLNSEKWPETIRAYCKGQADATARFIEVLERWKE